MAGKTNNLTDAQRRRAAQATLRAVSEVKAAGRASAAARERRKENWDISHAGGTGANALAARNRIAQRHAARGANGPTPETTPESGPAIPIPLNDPGASFADAPDGRIYRLPGGAHARWDAPADRLTPVRWDPRERDWSVALPDPRTLRHTAQQRRRMAEINNKIQWVRDRDDWDDREKESAVRQLEAMRLGIEPMPIPEEEDGPRYPEGRRPGDVWRHDSGATLTRDAKGNVKVLEDAPDTGGDRIPFADYQNAFQTVQRNMFDPESGKPPSSKEVNRRVQEMFRGWREMSGGDGGREMGDEGPPMEDLEYTAKKHGISVEEVKQRLGVR